MQSWKLMLAAAVLAGVAGCKSTSDTAGPATGDSAGATTDGQAGGTSTGSADGTGGTSGGAGGVPALVSVNLQNVLNNLSLSLQVDRNSIPVTAQVPIDVAAAVCGVSVDALAASVASGRGSCTATTTSAQLNQAVQQQISTGGDVQGGAQTMNMM